MIWRKKRGLCLVPHGQCPVLNWSQERLGSQTIFLLFHYYYTHFAGVKKNICFYFSLLLSPLPTDDVRAFLFCCVLKRHTQVFVQSKYKKGLLHNTQGSSSARFGYFFALVRLVLLVWCFFLWMLTRLGQFIQNMVVSSLTKKKEAGNRMHKSDF